MQQSYLITYCDWDVVAELIILKYTEIKKMNYNKLILKLNM